MNQNIVELVDLQECKLLHRQKANEYMRRYRAKHAEQTREYANNYYHNNPKTVLECQKTYRKKQFTCTCGATITNGSKYLHMKSAAHAAK